MPNPPPPPASHLNPEVLSHTGSGSTERAHIDGGKFRTLFLLLLVAAISLLFLAVTWAFIKPLLLAALLTGLSRPVYRWVLRRCHGRETLASALTVLLLFLVIAGPVTAFAGVVIKQAVHVSTVAIPYLKEHMGKAGEFDAHEWLVKRFPSLGDYVPAQEEIMEHVSSVAQTAGGFLVGSASRMTAGTASFLLDLFVMLYAMFFFLRDGQKILEKIFYYVPMMQGDEEQLLERLTSVTRATIKGTIVIGIIQGSLAGLGFWVAGIEGVAFWSTVMMILSIIPGIGATLIWLPAVIFLYAKGNAVPATLLGIWCAAVVGTIDNFLRPSLVGNDAKMPDLLVLVGTLGGLFLFGPVGFIFGPLVCGLFLTIWSIYGSVFRNILPPVHNLRTHGGGKQLDDPAPGETSKGSV